MSSSLVSPRISKSIKNPSWRQLLLMTQSNLVQKIRAWLHALSLPPNHLYTDLSPLPLWSSFSELSEMLSPRLQPSFYPK